MTTLWLPPTVLTERAHLKDRLEKSLRLPDGRVLAWKGPWDSEWGAGGVWDAPAKRKEGRGLRIIATVDNTPNWGPLLHCSFSYESRLPSWNDVRVVKDAFFGPERDSMMVLPREEDYVNHHAFTFHLWETPERWGLR